MELIDKHIIEDHNPFSMKILPLQDLSLIKMIVHLCHLCVQKRRENDLSNDIKGKCCTPHNNKFIYSSFVLNSFKALQVPSSFTGMIEKYLTIVGNEINRWVNYQNLNIFREEFSSSNYINQTVWNCDGSINYQKTAVKMLSDPSIKEITKFKIKCVYCLEDELKSEESNKRKFDSGLEEISFLNPMVCYWYHSLKRTKRNRSAIFDAKSMIMEKRADNIHAILYFWNRLDLNYQISTAIHLIQKFGFKYQNALLLQMSESLRYHILGEIGGKIISNFADASCWESALSTWQLIKNTIITQQKFSDVISDILRQYRNGIDFLEFLENLWRTTPDRLKHFCLDINNGMIIDMLTNFQDEKLDMQNRFLFLLVILPDMCIEERRNVLDMITRKVRTDADNYTVFDALIECDRSPWILDKLLNLCLSDTQQRTEFRKKWIRKDVIEEYCQYLCHQAEWRAFDEFVRLYLPDERNIEEYKAQFFKTEKVHELLVSYLCCDTYHCDLTMIIDDVFPETTAASNYRRDLLLSDVAFDYFYSCLKSGRFVVYKNFDEFLSSEKYVKMFKEHVIQHLSSEKLTEILISPKFNESQWNDVLCWLCNRNDKTLSKFKRSLHHRCIFLSLLKDFIEKMEVKDVSVLNYFLYWYFKSSAEVKKFKFEEIFKYTDVACIIEKSISDSKDFPQKSYDFCKFHFLMKWFLENDKSLIRKFRKVYAHHTIVKLLSQEICVLIKDDGYVINVI